MIKQDKQKSLISSEGNVSEIDVEMTDSNHLFALYSYSNKAYKKLYAYDKYKLTILNIYWWNIL